MRIESLRQQICEGTARVEATVTWEDSDRPTRTIYFETSREFADGLAQSQANGSLCYVEVPYEIDARLRHRNFGTPFHVNFFSRDSLANLMRDMNRRDGTTFVFSTHDPMVLEQADRVVRLVDGKIASDERKGGALAS